MNTKSLIAFSIFTSVALPSWAGSGGTPLTSDNFEDYLVRVMANSGRCGGQLVAGKYVITAAHCISEGWGSIYSQSEKWQSISTDGVLTSDEINEEDPFVYFGNATDYQGKLIGVSHVALFHDYVFMYQHGLTVRSNYDDQVAQEWLNAYGLSAEDVYSSPKVYGDIAVYELNESVKQNTASVLLTTSKNISDGSELRWAGWGIENDGGSAPATANYGSMTYQAYPYNNWWTQFSFDVDMEKAAQKNGSSTCQGDSGSPVTVDGQVLGYVHSMTSTCGRDDVTAFFTAAWHYIPWLAQQINAVNTVGKKELKADAAGAHSATWTIPVQSLKVDDVTFTPQLVDSTGLFTSDDLSNCEGTFSTGESCEVTVTFNAAGNVVSSDASATLVLNDELSIPLTFAITSPTSPTSPTGDSGSSTSSGGSGGGSAGWGSLLALVGLGFSRRFRR